MKPQSLNQWHHFTVSKRPPKLSTVGVIYLLVYETVLWLIIALINVSWIRTKLTQLSWLKRFRWCEWSHEEPNLKIKLKDKHQFSCIIGESHKMVYLDLITLKFSSQQYIFWRFGTCEAFTLPVHKSIILHIEKINTNLKNQIKKDITELTNQNSAIGKFHLKRLSDKSSIQIRHLFLVEQKDINSNFHLTDGRVDYTLKFPCILQIEVTNGNF